MPPRGHLKRRYEEPTHCSRTPTREEWAVALAALLPRQQAVIVLLIQGFTQQQMAAKLGISQQAISSRIERARLATLAHLDDMLHEPPPLDRGHGL